MTKLMQLVSILVEIKHRNGSLNCILIHFSSPCKLKNFKERHLKFLSIKIKTGNICMNVFNQSILSVSFQIKYLNEYKHVCVLRRSYVDVFILWDCAQHSWNYHWLGTFPNMCYLTLDTKVPVVRLWFIKYIIHVYSKYAS